MSLQNTPFLLNKLRKQVTEIKRFLDLQQHSLHDWKFSDAKHSVISIKNIDENHWQECHLPHLWGGYNKTTWFHCNTTIPNRFINQALALSFDIIDEFSEALLIVNGEIIQGIDRNHTEAWLFDKTPPNRRLEIFIEAHSGHNDDLQQFRNVSLIQPDESMRSFYFTLKNAVEVVAGMRDSHPQRATILETISTFCSGIDWRNPGSKEFRDSCIGAHRRITRIFDQKSSEIDATVTPVGHAHIDVAWLWTFDETKRKCARTFSTALQNMKKYPEFHFIQSQPQLYEFIKDAYPDIYEKIKIKIQNGQWEPVGGMWVEADCNIPSGESLVRQIFYGKKFFRDEFDIDVQNLWLPDVFGYSPALPQILLKSEIYYFFTAKIAWNDINQFPYSTFMWQGIDGSQVFSHLTFLKNLYNSELAPADLKEAWEKYKQKENNASLLLSYGFGDGGGGPTTAHIENARCLENFPGLPKLKRQSVAEFFENSQENSNDIPIWSGELYLEYHRGTFTTQARTKWFNRKCEIALRESEFFLAFEEIVLNNTAAISLEKEWKLLLLNQFHDILPGSSIPEVYEDAELNYHKILKSSHKHISESCRNLGLIPDPLALTFFNSLNWRRNEPVEVRLNELPYLIHLQNERQSNIPFQILSVENGKTTLLVQPEINGLSAQSVTIVPQVKSPSFKNNLRVSEHDLQNKWYKINLNKSGQISQLIDRQSGKEIIHQGAPANVLQTFEDAPTSFEAWDIDNDFMHKPLSLFKCTERTVLETGPLRGCVQFIFKSKKSTIQQKIHIYRDSPRIDFATTIDWHEQRVLLKVLFPVNLKSESATFDIQYGNIERPTHRNTSWETARFEVPVHKWMDISEADYGVAILNDSKYGCDIIGNKMRLTLLRSPYPPDPVEPWRSVQYDKPTDQGEHHFVYSLLPHQGDWRSADVPRRAYELNIPITTHAGRLPNAFAEPLFTLDHKNLIIEAIKKAETGAGIILRFYDSAGQRGASKFDAGKNIKSVFLCNLLEETICELDPVNDGWHIDYKPYEIITLKILFS
ncbi:MAG: alpha-mannosidase [Calditrichaeota bacterium]|nr:MAG: alpha-mannosidase [Calditrichota bacterium]